MIKSEVIKMLETSKFTVELVKTEDDYYVILSESRLDRVLKQTNRIQNFKTASLLFDSTVLELEGH